VMLVLLSFESTFLEKSALWNLLGFPSVCASDCYLFLGGSVDSIFLFWIILLNIILPIILLLFDQTPFYRKSIWPKHYLAKRHLIEISHREVIWPKDFLHHRKGHLTESTFYKKCQETEKNWGAFDRKYFLLKEVVRPKVYFTKKISDKWTCHRIVFGRNLPNF
jgi:hypothetical protein